MTPDPHEPSAATAATHAGARADSIGAGSRASGPRLDDLPMVNPQQDAHRRYLPVHATDPQPLPSRPFTPTEPVHIVGAGRTLTLPEFQEATAATSLLILEGTRYPAVADPANPATPAADEDEGVAIRHEWYADGIQPTDLMLGASMTKSALAHLVGVAVHSGALRLADRVVDHVPELADSGYAQTTVEHVLTMTSGVDWREDYRDPTSPAPRLIAALLTDGGSSREVLTEIGPQDAPGTRYAYCTADSQVLDWVRERATGIDFRQALEDLWAALGCQDDALVGIDSVGVPFGGGAVAATPRDWARIGLLQVDGTRWWSDGAQLLPPGWAEAASRPSRPFLTPGRLPSSITTHAGFGYHWWPLDAQGMCVTADGSRGQFCYVDRQARVVVVKTSRWEYADWLVDRQCRDLTYLALPALAGAFTDY